jgi:hypothetical protein
MAIQIGNQGTITISTNVTVDNAKPTYAFSISPDGNACGGGFQEIIYTTSAILGIGSTLYTNIELTIPTTYSAISNPNNPGQNYFTITGNTITGTAFCD